MGKRGDFIRGLSPERSTQGQSHAKKGTIYFLWLSWSVSFVTKPAQCNYTPQADP